MQIIDNTNYKFERKFTECDTYQVKITTELLEELENCQNVSDVQLNIRGNSGTLSIPSSKSKKSKVFDLNIDSISRGEKERFEVNAFRSNQRVESLGSLQVRLNVQATSKVYDMTKKKISEVEDESKKHCAKELKLDKFANKQGLAYKVMKNKEARKSETVSNTIRGSGQVNPNDKSVNKSDIPIRQHILHLLAVKPSTKPTLHSALRRFSTITDFHEVDKLLNQLATLNKENMYQLSNQFIPEVREDWIHYTDEERRKISSLKSESRSNITNRNPYSQISRHSNRPPTPDSHENTRPKPLLAPHPSKTKIAALDMMARGISLNEISKTLNVPENLIQSWKSQELQIRQNFGKRSGEFSHDSQPRENTISPTSGKSIKSNSLSNNADEDSNSSFKTHTSNDEGFVSGDKRSPLVRSSYPKTVNNKRRSQHLEESISKDKPEMKKIHLSAKNTGQLSSHNDAQSSSSCDVTPKSDISQSSNSSLQSKMKLEKKNQVEPKINPKSLEDTQTRFNSAFEEYSKLCEKVKDCESQIENLRSKCKNGSEDYSKLYRLAKLLLADMESPKFQALTARIKQLELEMFDYLKIMSTL